MMLSDPGERVVSSRIVDEAAVIDGDTLKVDGRSIRLHGLDAPELRQTCADGWRAGEEARRALAAAVVGRPLTCSRVATDRYGRTVATCTIDGRDVGAGLVRSGMAWSYGRFAWRYRLLEGLAWLEGLGVHARSCMLPADWRAARRAT
jgi:endonuclease YncB( thermonuclease family)